MADIVGDNVFLFIPNLIGYARIVLAVLSFYLMQTRYLLTLACYVTSALLDAFDGYAARRYNQSTKFGGMLDQLTDRCGTLGLIAVLCVFYPNYLFHFQLLMVIDISCHWVFIHSSMMEGKASHKSVGESNPLLHLYYTNRPFLFFMCVSYELFFIIIYVMHFTDGPFGLFGTKFFHFILKVNALFVTLKAIISVMQGYIGFKKIAMIDTAERNSNKAE